MAYKGIDCRATSGFATDPANYTNSLGEPAPITRGLFTGFGWSTNLTSSARDRSASYTAQQAGIIFVNNAGGVTRDLTIPLPDGPGTYNVKVAAGDFSAAQATKIVLLDGATVLATIIGATAVGEFLDAAGNIQTAAGWSAGNVAISVVVASGTITVRLGGHSSGTLASVLSSIAFDQTAGADTTPPTITGPGGSTGSTSSITVNENQTTVHTFTANETVTWDLNGGADVAKFAINSSTGALTFLAAPDFEAPGDADTNNTYIVGVRATDTASNATTQTCTVTVANVADTPPTAPTIGATSSITSSGATINWTDNSSDETSFQVQIETPSGANNWTNASSGSANPTAANVTSLAINGLSASTEYRARVRASNGAGSSAWSTGTAFTTSASGGGVGPLLLLLQQQA